ncbi:MAG: ABC transporter substrate-binding protein [Chitinophagaceae bacterium]|nr:ABC transporter substrate-binding protein [Chitinophagaceae bacterium]
MKKTLFLLVVLFSLAARSQSVPRIAVFAPLYLDSAFNDTSGYRYAKNVFPKFINPGLEFYEGVQLALDSMNAAGTPLEVYIYDSRSAKQRLEDQLEKAIHDSVGLIIAHCSSQEVKTLADAGARANIPVINVNMPNDGGVTGNPFYVMLNPTLRTQCEGIYKYVQKYHGLDQVIVFRKKGQLEDRIKNYFEDAGKATRAIPIKMRYVELNDSFTVDELKKYLDTTDQTLCIAGTMDENFGKRMVQQLASLSKTGFKATVMGMPTWDGLPFNRPEYRGVDLVYSTPYYNPKLDKVSAAINNYFKENMFARPSDMVFRGYEVMWRFGSMLQKYGSDLSSNLSTKQYRVFTDYDIQPVISRQNMTLDYFENRRLYFVKWQEGVIKLVN